MFTRTHMGIYVYIHMCACAYLWGQNVNAFFTLNVVEKCKASVLHTAKTILYVYRSHRMCGSDKYHVRRVVSSGVGGKKT